MKRVWNYNKNGTRAMTAAKNELFIGLTWKLLFSGGGVGGAGKGGLTFGGRGIKIWCCDSFQVRGMSKFSAIRGKSCMWSPHYGKPWDLYRKKSWTRKYGWQCFWQVYILFIFKCFECSTFIVKGLLFIVVSFKLFSKIKGNLSSLSD